MTNLLTFTNGRTTRHVHPDAHSTQALLRKAGFRQVADGSSEATAVPDPDPFAFLTSTQADALRAAGFATLDDLATADAETLLAVKGVGPGTLEKIHAALA